MYPSREILSPVPKMLPMSFDHISVDLTLFETVHGIYHSHFCLGRSDYTWGQVLNPFTPSLDMVRNKIYQTKSRIAFFAATQVLKADVWNLHLYKKNASWWKIGSLKRTSLLPEHAQITEHHLLTQWQENVNFPGW